MELKDSKTKENLMRAFAGESQARNRYTFAAQLAIENFCMFCLLLGCQIKYFLDHIQIIFHS